MGRHPHAHLLQQPLLLRHRGSHVGCIPRPLLLRLCPGVRQLLLRLLQTLLQPLDLQNVLVHILRSKQWGDWYNGDQWG